jgi:hypothetical protein
MLCLTSNSLNHELQFLVKLRVEELFLFYVFSNTTISSLNFNGVYASN